MTLDPLRIKNSQTAARAVLNIMAHYGLQPLSYKPATFAEFMLLALRTFTNDRATSLQLEEGVLDVLNHLQAVPTTKPVALMLERALQRSNLIVHTRSWREVKVADLLFLSRGRGYRYTKIVGNQEFRTRLDEVLLADLQGLAALGGSDSRHLCVLLAHMVKLDLYMHFHSNAPSTAESIRDLRPYEEISLYLAFKSFLMAKQDVFDPELKGLGLSFGGDEVNALQRFLQLQGIYRFSDWLPVSSRFLADQFPMSPHLSEGEMPDMSLHDPREIWSALRRGLIRAEVG
ncbi:hypothetical protein [Deinococcus sp. QL22]|uniref:hypothetical protein n=1 Tax=Deinococcus sp. QL22 TaxID=2939437 RepID=UPI0020170B04|nr:hypothetical protein [Deinococcus sp. QL22]UQN08802.1 hypothetical protein M1R55_19540 [Deinococcus sp. QL22]